MQNLSIPTWWFYSFGLIHSLQQQAVLLLLFPSEVTAKWDENHFIEFKQRRKKKRSKRHTKRRIAVHFFTAISIFAESLINGDFMAFFFWINSSSSIARSSSALSCSWCNCKWDEKHFIELKKKRSKRHTKRRIAKKKSIVLTANSIFAESVHNGDLMAFFFWINSINSFSSTSCSSAARLFSWCNSKWDEKHFIEFKQRRKKKRYKRHTKRRIVNLKTIHCFYCNVDLCGISHQWRLYILLLDQLFRFNSMQFFCSPFLLT